MLSQKGCRFSRHPLLYIIDNKFKGGSVLLLHFVVNAKRLSLTNPLKNELHGYKSLEANSSKHLSETYEEKVTVTEVTNNVDTALFNVMH
jgi:hypothetical protein